MCIYILKLFIAKSIRYIIFIIMLSKSDLSNIMLSISDLCNIYPFLSHIDLGKWLIVAKNFPGRDIVEHLILKNRGVMVRYFKGIKNWKCYYFFQDSGFPMRLITQLPILPFQRRFIGGTEYIDGIRSTDLTAPIMVGVDCYRRPYIVIAYKCFGEKWISWDGNERDFMGANGSRRLVLTVFNRYTGLRGEGSWCKAGSGSYSGCPILLSSNTLLSKNNKRLFTKNICELLTGSPVSYINGLEQLSYVDCKLISK